MVLAGPVALPLRHGSRGRERRDRERGRRRELRLGRDPGEARIGTTDWTTSLFPKNGGYLVPVKDAVRKAETLDVGDTVTVQLDIDV